MTDEEHKQLAEQLTVTVELCGTNWTPAAFRAVMMQLRTYPADAAIAALQRCHLEVTGRLSLAAIIERIDDGRPTADEAWAQVGTDDENRTIVSTDEAMTARRELGSLLTDDPVAARMAFKDAYKRIVTENRAQGLAASWFASLGHDPKRRTAPIMAAVERGRLSVETAQNLLGHYFPVKALPASGKVDELGQKRVAGLLSGLVKGLELPEEPAVPLPEPKATGQSQEEQMAAFDERNKKEVA